MMRHKWNKGILTALALVASFALVAAVQTSPSVSAPMEWRLANGDFEANAYQTNKFGSNPSVATGTFELISRTGPDHARIYVNATMSLASTSANDTAAGSGAQTVRVIGIDENFALVEETVTLAGQSEVAMVAEIMLPYRLFVVTSGTTGESNEGRIWIGTGTFTAGVPAVKYGQIDLPSGGKAPGQSEMALFACRAGYICLMKNVVVTTDADAEFHFFRQTAPGYVYRYFDRFAISAGLWTFDHHETPIVFPEKTILGIQALSTSGATDEMSASFDVIEVKMDTGGEVWPTLTGGL